MADNPHLIRRIPSKKHLIAVPHSVVPNTKWHVFGACDRAEPDRGSLKAQLTADVNVEGGLDRENMNTKPRRMLTATTKDLMYLSITGEMNLVHSDLQDNTLLKKAELEYLHLCAMAEKFYEKFANLLVCAIREPENEALDKAVINAENNKAVLWKQVRAAQQNVLTKAAACGTEPRNFNTNFIHQIENQLRIAALSKRFQQTRRALMTAPEMCPGDFLLQYTANIKARPLRDVLTDTGVVSGPKGGDWAYGLRGPYANADRSMTSSMWSDHSSGRSYDSAYVTGSEITQSSKLAR